MFKVAGFAALFAMACLQQAAAQSPDAAREVTQRCALLAQTMQGHWPDVSTRVVSASLQTGPYSAPAMPGGPPAPAPITLPEHCEMMGIMHERVGVDGQHYAIRFHLRMPSQWNGRFFYQGGGGSNGVVGDALGAVSTSSPPALVQGYAVVSQDTGHDNASNTDPTRGGAVAFGFDPQARSDYGHASLDLVAATAKAVVTAYYAKAPAYSYFVGCSKGGQEGMMFAQRYPEEFDGIVAAAPGFSLPRAAVAEAWDVQAVAAVPPATPGTPIANLAAAFGQTDLALVADAILRVCDADDGVKDGMLGAFASCTDARVIPAVNALVCTGEKTARCLSAAQVGALTRIYAGPRDHAGKQLYSNWQWDPGIAGPGWRLWKMGSADGRIPPLNVILGGASLAAVFTTPPTPVDADLPSGHYQLNFDFSRDAVKIYATDAPFTHSAWEEIAARSSDLDRFRAHGGKLIVPHGVSDPVFSINDTLAWYREVDGRNHRRAAQFVRVFPVPGMGHCGGGPATDDYDAFHALTDWVEGHHAPDRILATAGAASPWPRRTRPLCAYPTMSHYVGHGDIESAESFVCR
jgi:hypothetical protein